MPPLNRYYKCSKLSEVKFRYLLRLFALDLTASDTARLTGLSVRAVNEVYLRLRRHLHQRCPVPVELGGALELDESYFGPRRVRGKRGRGAGSKTIVFGLFKRGGQVYPEIVPDCSKKTLQGIIRGKIDPAAMVNTDGWRGYDGLVDVGFDRHYRVPHGHDEFVQGAAHINGIESFGSCATSRLHQFAGVPTCMVPASSGIIDSAFRSNLWNKYFMAAPARRPPCVAPSRPARKASPNWPPATD